MTKSLSIMYKTVAKCLFTNLWNLQIHSVRYAASAVVGARCSSRVGAEIFWKTCVELLVQQATSVDLLRTCVIQENLLL